MQITLTEALVKLKLYDRKIQKLQYQISNTYPVVDYRTGTNDKGEISGLTEAELKANAQSSLDKLLALIANRRKLKALISQANATTTVEIGGETYTIVQAIERKNSIDIEKSLLERLENAYANVQTKVQHINVRAKERANEIVEAQVQSESKNKKTEEIEALYNLIYNKNNAEIMDPYNIKDLIERMRDDIEKFEQEVDVKLSIVNAQTMIDVDFIEGSDGE